ncbi:MAG: sodium:calcium antiporter [Gaiellaceae bacterium]
MSTPLLILIFVAAAGATWGAGIVLTGTTDSLDRRLNLGDAIGGLVLLSIAGTLPEIAITVSAAASGHFDLAAGNLIGGIATQTMVLVLCDLAVPSKPLTYLVGSLVPVLEGLLVILVVVGVLLGALLPPSVAIGGVSPASIGIVVLWIVGVYIVNNVRKSPKWRVVAAGAEPGRPHHRVVPKVPSSRAHWSIASVALLFGAACLVTLLAGVALAITGNDLANRAGINGVVFGATLLALATALPEISSGIAAVRKGDNQLALGDIFGGNAFQVCLFLVADLIAAKPVLSQAGILNSWLAALGIALTAIFAMGVVLRAERPTRIGPDSLLAIAVYAIGIAGIIRLS